MLKRFSSIRGPSFCAILSASGCGRCWSTWEFSSSDSSMSGRRAFWTGAKLPPNGGTSNAADPSYYRSGGTEEPSGGGPPCGLEGGGSDGREVRSRRNDDLYRSRPHPRGLRRPERGSRLPLQFPFRRHLCGLVSGGAQV